jgi:hypothetical protein
MKDENMDNRDDSRIRGSMLGEFMGQVAFRQRGNQL